MGEKVYISSRELLNDSFALGSEIIRSGFKPTVIIAIWRGGAPIGIAVQEFLDYFGLKRLDDLPSLAELRDFDSLNVELDLGLSESDFASPGKSGEGESVPSLEAVARQDAVAIDDGDEEQAPAETPDTQRTRDEEPMDETRMAGEPTDESLRA